MKKASFINKDKLISDLRMARMNVYYADFIKKNFRLAIMASVGINIFVFFMIAGAAKASGSYYGLLILLITLPMGALMFFFMKMPESKIIKSRKELDAEITSAIRFIVLDLKANASIYAALENLIENFEEIGKYVKEIIIEVRLGSSLEKALDDAVERVPSESFRVLLWQLLNHIQTGTDITHNLDTIVREIVEEQKIAFRKYGKKLNVVSLFYMIVAIILPTIGFTIISAL